jgi:hypothetical protein
VLADLREILGPNQRYVFTLGTRLPDLFELQEQMVNYKLNFANSRKFLFISSNLALQLRSPVWRVAYLEDGPSGGVYIITKNFLVKLCNRMQACLQA